MSAMRWTSASSDTSVRIALAVYPRSRSCLAQLSAASPSRSATRTAAPASANRRAIPEPMPMAPPVTTAVRPDSESSSVNGVGVGIDGWLIAALLGSWFGCAQIISEEPAGHEPSGPESAGRRSRTEGHEDVRTASIRPSGLAGHPVRTGARGRGARPQEAAMKPRPIPPEDRIWLALDRPTNPMTITSVLWTSTPVDPDALRAVVRQRLVERYPVFRQLALAGPLPGSGWWEDDPGFDLDRHLRVSPLPGPGDRAALERFVAGRRGEPLDRAHPLWSVDLLTGYGSGSA